MVRRKKQDEEIEDPHFKSPDDNLYQVLGVDRSATHDEIRKAYHKLALRLHPDKNPGDETAKEKFQSLQNVIAILGDPEKREVYDQTGSVDDVDLSGDIVQSLYKFLRTLYKRFALQVAEEDIDQFAASYRGSKEEAKDLKDLYIKCKGDMKRLFSQMICSEPRLDTHRFMDIIDSAISNGELKEWRAYRKWASEVAKMPAHPNPLAPQKRKKQGESSSDLVAAISNRGQHQMESLAATLEAKYGRKEETGRGCQRKRMEEPSEEEFLAAQQRVLKKSKDQSIKR